QPPCDKVVLFHTPIIPRRAAVVNSRGREKAAKPSPCRPSTHTAPRGMYYLQPQSPPQQLSATSTGMMLLQPQPPLHPPQQSMSKMIQRQSLPPNPHSLKLFIIETSRYDRA